MRKPVIAVSEKWLRPFSIENAHRAYTPLCFQRDSNRFSFPEASIVGLFGHFITVLYDNRFYLMPELRVQWLLWSYENQYGHQFSEEEQLLLVGAYGFDAINKKLESEMQALCAWLEQPNASQTQPVKPLKKTLYETMDNFLNECPEPQFFDPVVSS